MSEVRIGVIGGSGLYQMEGLQVEDERQIETPFGEPSDPFILGDLDGNKVAFLARHGRGHRILPSELNFRANIYGFKVLGVEWLVSVSAVGSMKIDYRPTDIVIPDQFFDRTRHRVDTFFGNGLVAHVSLAHPICPVLHEIFFEGAKQAGARVHKGGTYLCMEGPQFSTRAESEIYRQWGVDLLRDRGHGDRLRLLARRGGRCQRPGGYGSSPAERRNGSGCSQANRQAAADRTELWLRRVPGARIDHGARVDP
jgi:5'-methylthioadenosine phosphorylase